MGCVLFITDAADKTAGETERALAETAASFWGGIWKLKHTAKSLPRDTTCARAGFSLSMRITEAVLPPGEGG